MVARHVRDVEARSSNLRTPTLTSGSIPRMEPLVSFVYGRLYVTVAPKNSVPMAPQYWREYVRVWLSIVAPVIVVSLASKNPVAATPVCTLAIVMSDAGFER